ncbi:unnamed protein product [Alopecurus aequalis]
MSLWRRFLYLVVDNHKRMPSSPWYTLHRIDTFQLFHSHGYAGGRANPVVEAPLPEREMSFDLSGRMRFSLLGRCKDKIVGVDGMGRGVLYDDSLHSVRPLPTMAATPKLYRTLSVAVDSVGAGDDGSVYVMEADHPPGRRRHVQELVYQHKEEDWAWRSLPPPPYVRPRQRKGCRFGGDITCHAVESYREGDGSLVWVSAAGRGTYWLDTATHVWTKAGDWVLPFRGQAVPIPELGIWLGFSAASRGDICASDLAAAVDEDRPPAADQVWEGFAVPDGFHELYSRLVYLGDRQFCVAKIFEWTPRLFRRRHCPLCCYDLPDENEGKCFAMLTGLEVAHTRRCHRVIRHKSLRYCLGESFTGCVL